MNPKAWKGLRYPDSDLVGLVCKFARPSQRGELLAVDVGCGAGRHTQLLNELGYMAVGIDSDVEMVRAAEENGVEVFLADAESFRPPSQVHLVACWGVTMIFPAIIDVVSSWNPKLIIADWRSFFGNTCVSWQANRPLDCGSVLLSNPGHILDGLTYRFFNLKSTEIVGYQRIHAKHVTKFHQDCQGSWESNAWYQTVHQRIA